MSVASSRRSSKVTCGVDCEGGTACALAKRDGHVAEAQKLSSDWEKREKTYKLRMDIREALSWDDGQGKWAYRFKFGWRTVCIATWAEAYNVPRATLYRLKRDAEKDADALRSAGHVDISSAAMRKYARTRGSGTRTGRAMAWLQQLATDTGEKMPVPASGRGGDEGDEEEKKDGEIRLPFVLKSDVYQEYRTFCALNEESSVSEAQFLRDWRSRLPHVRCSRLKGGFAMCDKCTEFTGKIKVAKSKAEAEKLREERAIHLDLQKAQRSVYYQNRVRGASDKQTYLSLIIDAMDQKKTYLPLVNRRQKKDSLTLIKQKVMGVIAHGHGSYLYVGQPPLPSGANFTLECLWRTLMKLHAAYTENAMRFPRYLTVQMDNASDNKAHAVLAFVAHLVEGGVFDSVALNFLMVGHTHEDIDQLFSVISRRFKTLVTGTRARSVISFEDFQKEVKDAFIEDHKPKCVERVLLNRDYVGWLTPFRDQRMMGITNFRHFLFRLMTPDEKLARPQHHASMDERAIMKLKTFMSDGDDKYKPGATDIAAYGQVYVLRNGPVTGRPAYEEFKDLTVQTKGRDGVPKPLPASHQNKTSAQILELHKASWKAWVEDPAHGADAEQRRQFQGLLDSMYPSVADVPARVLTKEPAWGLPVRPAAGDALPSADVETEEQEQQLANSPPPSPRLAYGDMSRAEAQAPAREHRVRTAARLELEASRAVLDAIQKGDVLLVKAVEERATSGGSGAGASGAVGRGASDGASDGEDSDREGSCGSKDGVGSGASDSEGSRAGVGRVDRVQYWLGRAEKDYAAVPREAASAATILVQWYVGLERGGGKAAVNDLNARFKLWYQKGGKGEKVKNKRVMEEVERVAVVMIGVQFTAGGFLKRESKKGIGNLGIGYTFTNTGNQLVYTRGELGV